MFLSRGQQRTARSEGQLDIDWAICLVRWGLVIGIPLVGLLDPAHRMDVSDLAVAMIAASGYGLILTLLLILRFFPAIASIVVLVLDTVGVLALLHFSGGTNSPFFFYPLFPILVAVLRYGWQSGLASASAFVLAYGLWIAAAWQQGQQAPQLFEPVLRVFLYVLPVAIAAGLEYQPSEGKPGGSLTQLAGGTFLPDQVKMVFEMASTLSATLNYQRVLDAILDISRLGFAEFGQRIGESVGMVLLYDEDGLLSVVSHRNLFVQEDETRQIKGRDGIVEQAVVSATAMIGGAPALDAELRVFQSLAPCKSMICVPLRAGFETYGVVLFASTKPNAYTAEHMDLLAIFCNQATVALQNASLYQSLREERDKIIDKEEEARHKLARDLHDGPTQDVAAIAMRLNFARLLVDRDPVRARSELARLEDLAHRTVREIRSMLFTLRPVILETEGLVAALHQYAENLAENDGVPVTVDSEHYRDCLDMDTQGVVFAIIEEALNNAKKHADASRIWIRLAVEKDLFVAQIVDDGRGFDVSAVERDYSSRGSLGMINLKERADLVEGNINIESAPGQGTRITLIVPINPEPV